MHLTRDKVLAQCVEVYKSQE